MKHQERVRGESKCVCEIEKECVCVYRGGGQVRVRERGGKIGVVNRGGKKWNQESRKRSWRSGGMMKHKDCLLLEQKIEVQYMKDRTKCCWQVCPLIF